MNETPEEVENFHGVYLLCSKSLEKKYYNRCYIGYTVNPNRRITQHNRGKDFGGAKRTNNKGPWEMVMIIHGFPTNISALQFEWAWQYPAKSLRLKMIKNIHRKRPNETHFEYNFRILTEMLRIGPWNRLPLIIRWISSDYVKNFDPDKIPPMHMQICHGHVAIKKKSKLKQSDEYKLIDDDNSEQNQSLQKNINQMKSSYDYIDECHLCMEIIENPKRSKINCINPKCKLTCHIICLANLCLETGHYVPIEGDCPICETHFLWGDLIRKKNGYNDLKNYNYIDDEENYECENFCENEEICTDDSED